MAIFAFSLLAASGGCGAGGSYERLSGNGGGDVGAGGDAMTGSGGETPGSGGAGGNGAITGTGGAATGGVVGAGGQASGGVTGGGASGVAGHGGAGAGAGTGGSAGVPVGAGGQLVASGGATGTGGMVAAGGSGGSVVATGGTAGGGAPGGVGTGGAAGGPPGTGAAGGTPQRILSIDFVGGVVTSAGGAGGGTTTQVAMATTEVAGVKPAANWNSALGTASAAPLTPLRLADGSSLPASVTWSVQGSPSVYNVGFPDMPGDVRMMNGYLDPVSTTAVVNPVVTVTVSGLGSLTGGYDVYVYSFGSINNTDTRSRKLAIGAANFTVSQKGPSPTTFSGYVLGASGNYVVFKQVTGASFTLTSTAVAGLTKRAPVNGMQIVWPSAP